MSKKIKNKILLEEFDDNEPINFSIFKEDNNKDNRYDKQNEDIIYNINNDITNMKNIEIIDDIENFNDELNDYNLDNIYLDNNINYLDMIDANSDINIEVFDDENNEKLVRFSLNVIIDEKSGESVMIDLNITKETYLMIAEELFK